MAAPSQCQNRLTERPTPPRPIEEVFYPACCSFIYLKKFSKTTKNSGLETKIKKVHYKFDELCVECKLTMFNDDDPIQKLRDVLLEGTSYCEVIYTKY